MIGHISPAIPALRKIKDHVEAEFNHYRRGKSHTSPEAEEDIRKLQEALHHSKVHVYDPRGRMSKSKVLDYVAIGCDAEKVAKALDSFYAKHSHGLSTKEVWPDVDTAQVTWAGYSEA